MMLALLESGQDAKVINRRYFSTALHLACEAGQVVCARILLEANCDPLVRDSHGRMAMHYAAAADFDCAALLIYWKCDVNVCDNDGLAPLDYTFDEQCVKVLRKKGATVSLFGSVAGGHSDRVRALLKAKAPSDLLCSVSGFPCLAGWRPQLRLKVMHNTPSRNS